MTSTSTMRILEPVDGVLAFYDGRVSDRRLISHAWNWLDDAAYSLGISSYAVVSNQEALVYDTHISTDHALVIRRELERRGVTSIRVILSHHHRDHVAGTEVFSDCEIWASEKTADALARKRESYADSIPPISPLIMPTKLFDGTKRLSVGAIDVELRPLDIHSYDGVAVYLPASRLLLAGDALEDSVTYVAEPARLSIHLSELDRLMTWDISSILPGHGDPIRIANGGYSPSFIKATKAYVTKLLRALDEPELRNQTLAEFAAESFEEGSLIYCEAYEAVHQDNLQSVLGA